MRNIIKTISLAGAVLAVFLLATNSFAGRKYIKVDGSSTVYPISEAVAEEFGAQTRGKASVTIGVSGTGGGFKKFCRSEIDISNASRIVKNSEAKLCKSNGVEYIELPIAYDGIAVVVNKKNDWANTITTAELKTLWEPLSQGKIMKWNQIRKNWPNEKINLLGPGVDSGTFDYFTKVINGKEAASRGDFMSSEDDNILVKGVSTDKYALGFFGFAYYENNKSMLKLLSVDGGAGPVKPSLETINNGTYAPLSRPIFIYVSVKSIEKKEVSDFVNFYLDNSAELSREVGYIDLPENIQSLVRKRLENRVTGSAYNKNTKKGAKLEDIYK